MDMNIGPTPEGATNQFQRWVAWMKIVQQLMPQKQGQGKGRPPSGNQPPHQVQKGGAGGRSVVAESK